LADWILSPCSDSELSKKCGLPHTCGGVRLEHIDAVAMPGVYVLEASIDLGKTEAALYTAYPECN
jgi:hypothetical protein